jgi:hypothetical protein
LYGVRYDMLEATAGLYEGMTMKRCQSIAMVATALLVGMCSISYAQQQQPEQGGSGRWVIVPATANPLTNSGNPLIYAWRLDTETGALEMCTYDPGGYPNPASKLPQTESLSCTRLQQAGSGQ